MSDITMGETFEVIGLAALDVARAIEAQDNDMGERASSAFLDALSLLPGDLRATVVEAVTSPPRAAILATLAAYRQMEKVPPS